MSEYTLSNSAAVIDAAISSVAGADAAPTAGSQNMVTSGGVKTYVDGLISALNPRLTAVEADVLELQDQRPYSGELTGSVAPVYNQLKNIPFAVSFTSNNFAPSISNGVITVNKAGVYSLNFTPSYSGGPNAISLNSYIYNTRLRIYNNSAVIREVYQDSDAMKEKFDVTLKLLVGDTVKVEFLLLQNYSNTYGYTAYCQLFMARL